MLLEESDVHMHTTSCELTAASMMFLSCGQLVAGPLSGWAERLAESDEPWVPCVPPAAVDVTGSIRIVRAKRGIPAPSFIPRQVSGPSHAQPTGHSHHSLAPLAAPGKHRPRSASPPHRLPSSSSSSTLASLSSPSLSSSLRTPVHPSLTMAQPQAPVAPPAGAPGAPGGAPVGSAGGGAPTGAIVAALTASGGTESAGESASAYKCSHQAS